MKKLFLCFIVLSLSACMIRKTEGDGGSVSPPIGQGRVYVCTSTCQPGVFMPICFQKPEHRALWVADTTTDMCTTSCGNYVLHTCLIRCPIPLSKGCNAMYGCYCPPPQTFWEISVSDEFENCLPEVLPW